MQLEKKNKNQSGETGFVVLFHLMLALIVFLPSMIQNGGLLTLCNDFNLQQIPLNMLANRAIHKGAVDWTFQVDLGSSFIGATSFYVTGSPFFYVSLLFPSAWYPYLVSWLFILKYAVAGITSYVYLKQFAKDFRYALIGSVLYAFSGFQAMNMMFYHFHDVVAFFPILLYGVDQLVQEKKKGILALGAFLGALTNFYFFVGEVIFLVIYFVFRYLVSDFKTYRKKFLPCLLEGVLGVCMAMVIFLPSILFNLENPRATELFPFERWFSISHRDLLYYLRVFLLPPEDMVTQSYVVWEEYSSWQAYLPMLGIAPVLLYQLKNRKNWLTRVLFVFFFMSFVPVLNSIFYMMTSNNYHRWYNMFILLLSAAVIAVLEEHERYPLSVMEFLLAAFTGILYVGSLWWDTNKFRIIYHDEAFRVTFFIAITGFLASALIHLIFKNKSSYAFAMLIGVSVFAVCTNQNVLKDYQEIENMADQHGNDGAKRYYERLIAYQNLENPDESYRFRGIDNSAFMVGEISGDACFLSTVNGSVIELHEQISGGREVFTPYELDGMDELFSAKYEIVSNRRDDVEPVATIQYSDVTEYIYEKDHILPMGFSYDSYVTQSECSGFTNEEKRFLMLQTLVIPDEEEKQVSLVLKHFDLSQALLDWELLAPVWEASHRASSETFTRTKNGFESRITTENETYVFFSVPYDRGFHCTVNGVKEEIVKINGLMAVRVPAGSSEICFTNRNMALRVGFLISILSFAVWIFYRKK